MPGDLTVSAIVDLLMQKATAAEIRAVIEAASAAQGALADSALQPDGDGSQLTGLTAAQVGLGAIDPSGPNPGDFLIGVADSLYEKKTLDETRQTIGGGVMNARTGTTEVANSADLWVGTTLTNAAATTYTVPVDSTFDVGRIPQEGTVIPIYSMGPGLVTVVPDTGVTIASRDAAMTLVGQFSGAALVHTSATDGWILVGDLTA